jgi:acetyltransferase-like isoleucine patch superfamily enzyme|tara:strand:+ start:237 stop:899 length:663 start_codon:yes stop_codon:yes gene_type:complete
MYVKHYLRPQFKQLGKGGAFFKPQYLKLFGSHISVDDFPTIIGARDANVQLTSWNIGDWKGELKIGKYCLITPGVRIMAAESIEIGDACMFAHGAYISDADWHGIYDRSEPVGNTKPIILKDNVWIGDSAIVCKGVTIGENSIIGAGAVVTKNIPANVVAAGNPAKVVKNLDQGDFISRKDFYKDPIQLAKDFDNLDKFNLKDNTLIGWIRSIFAPSKDN